MNIVKLINILKLVVKICQILVKIKNTLSIIIDTLSIIIDYNYNYLSLYELKSLRSNN